jgi:hypothetical protein
VDRDYNLAPLPPEREAAGGDEGEQSVEQRQLWHARRTTRALRADLDLSRADLETTERELAERRAEAATAAERGRRWAALRSHLASQLEEVERDIARLERSRSWRLAHALLTALRMLALRRSAGTSAPAAARARLASALDELSAAEEWGETPEPAPTTPASGRGPEDERLGAEARARLGAAPAREQWPSVSVVITGERETGRLGRPSLASVTDYPELEIVVSDEAEAKAARQEARSAHASWRIAVEGTGPTSPSHAVNRAAGAARGELLLLVSADFTPVEPGWLRELVECLSTSGGAAAAPTLVDRAGTPARTAALTDLEEWRTYFDDVHGEIRIVEALRPVETRFGRDLTLAAPPGGVLLVRRASFESAGGLTPGFRSSLAEVDLCLKLLSTGGTLVSSGRSLAARGSLRAGSEAGRAADRDGPLLRDRWAPRVERELWRERLRSGGGVWSAEKCLATIRSSAEHADSVQAQELSAALGALGWRSTVADVDGAAGVPGECQIDLEICIGSADRLPKPSGKRSAAVLSESPAAFAPEDRLERYDAVLVEPYGLAEGALARAGRSTTPLVEDGAPPERVIETLRRRVEARSFCIKIGAPTWQAAQRWGDLSYARCLKAELERRGHPCVIQAIDDWESPRGQSCDIALQLRGRGRYRPRPAQLNVLWNISHPGDLTPDECEGFDLVLVASQRFARHLAGETSAPVLVLEQATDPHVFFPERDAAHEHELLFVANSRKVDRRILRDLLPTDHDLAVWGRQWEGLAAERHVLGEHLPLEEVRKAYSSASIVLNDHWDDMRAHGFVSNRIYDALACGAFVISDRLPEIAERFGSAVATYEGPNELSGLIEHFLSHPEERLSRGATGRAIVLAEHTFARRVDALLAHIDQTTATLRWARPTAGLAVDAGPS